MFGIYHVFMRFLGFRKSFAKRFTSSSVMVCFTLLQVVSLILFTLPACSRQASYPSPVQIGPDIVIDTSVLEREVPKFYTYRVQDKKVNFFVIKMEDRILSFLDACASCYPHKQGYRCEDNAVICRYCDVRFPISKLEKGIGNCYPIKLEGRTEKDKYLISVDDLDKAADKF
jgi:uncharacterized membrane protein